MGSSHGSQILYKKVRVTLPTLPPFLDHVVSGSFVHWVWLDCIFIICRSIIDDVLHEKNLRCVSCVPRYEWLETKKQILMHNDFICLIIKGGGQRPVHGPYYKCLWILKLQPLGICKCSLFAFSLSNYVNANVSHRYHYVLAILKISASSSVSPH